MVRRRVFSHGMTNSPEFSTWTDIQTRCYNENANSFKNYGGRGIKVCDRWLESFESFFEDMGVKPSKSHSIDRKDNSGNYSPDNCRWATRLEQASNKRSNVNVSINGVKKTVAQWCRELNVSPQLASQRYKKGFTGMGIFSSPVKNITHNGITDSYKGWSNRTGIKTTTIHMRISKYGWTVEKALTKGAVF